MKTLLKRKVLSVYLLSVIICGSVYWPIKTIDLGTSNFYIGVWVLAMITLATLATSELGLNWKKIMISCSLTIASVIFIKAVVDIIFDPTSHNLLPFELVIGYMAGFALANFGFLIGLMIRKANKS
jgi:hypothetical protein